MSARPLPLIDWHNSLFWQFRHTTLLILTNENIIWCLQVWQEEQTHGPTHASQHQRPPALSLLPLGVQSGN